MDTDGGSNMMPPPVPGLDMSGIAPPVPEARAYARSQTAVALVGLDALKRLVERSDEDFEDQRAAEKRLSVLEEQFSDLDTLGDKYDDLDNRVSDIENGDFVTEDGVNDAIDDHLNNVLSDAVSDALGDADVITKDDLRDTLDDYVEKTDLPDFEAQDEKIDALETDVRDLKNAVFELKRIPGTAYALDVVARLEVIETGLEQVRQTAEALKSVGLTEADIKRLKALSNLLGAFERQFIGGA